MMALLLSNYLKNVPEMVLSLKMMEMYLQKVICGKKISFLLASWRSLMKIAGSGSISQRHGSADPDPGPQQNVMDPQHWEVVLLSKIFIYLTAAPCSGAAVVPTTWQLPVVLLLLTNCLTAVPVVVLLSSNYLRTSLWCCFCWPTVWQLFCSGAAVTQ